MDLSPQVQFDPSGSINFQDAVEAAKRQISRQRLGLESQLQSGLSRYGQDFNTASTNLGESRDKAITGINDNLASNGIGRSGINVKAQADTQKDYLKNYADLQTQRNRSVEDLIKQIQDAHQGLLAQEEQLNFQQVAAQREKALQESLVQAAAGVNQAQVNSQQPVVTSTGAYVSPNQAQPAIGSFESKSIADAARRRYRETR